MEAWAVVASVFGFIGTVAAIVFGYKAYARNKDADAADTGENKGTVLTELGYIKKGIDNIERKQEKQDERYVEIIGRVTAVEASAKQAHKRIDNMESRTTRE